MADKNVDLFHSNHSSNRIRLAARKLGVTDVDQLRDGTSGLPGADQEQSDIM